jgi:hypothetical protein
VERCVAQVSNLPSHQPRACTQPLNQARHWCRAASSIDANIKKLLSMGGKQTKAADAVSPIPLPGIDVASSPVFSMDEVQKHKTADDCWLVLHGAWTIQNLSSLSSLIVIVSVLFQAWFLI